MAATATPTIRPEWRPRCALPRPPLRDGASESCAGRRREERRRTRRGVDDFDRVEARTTRHQIRIADGRDDGAYRHASSARAGRAARVELEGGGTVGRRD